MEVAGGGRGRVGAVGGRACPPRHSYRTSFFDASPSFLPCISRLFGAVVSSSSPQCSHILVVLHFPLQNFHWLLPALRLIQAHLDLSVDGREEGFAGWREDPCDPAMRRTRHTGPGESDFPKMSIPDSVKGVSTTVGSIAKDIPSARSPNGLPPSHTRERESLHLHPLR